MRKSTLFTATLMLLGAMAVQGQTPFENETTGKWGYKDQHGKIIITAKYDFAFDFSEGLAVVNIGGMDDGSWGFVDKTGKEIVPLKYAYAYNFKEERAAVTDFNDKHGYIDKTGKQVIPLKYDRAEHFSEGLAAVKLNGKWGFIDKTGREIISPKYDLPPYDFSNGKALVAQNDRMFYIDKTGKEISNQPVSNKETPNNNNNNNNSTREIKGNPNTSGIAAPATQAQEPFKDATTGKYGYKDQKGNIVIEPKYAYARKFKEERAEVSDLNDKHGYIDKTGKEIIPLKYDLTFDFSEGLATVKLNGKYGFR